MSTSRDDHSAVRTASAPGKLVFFGEYAVLAGGPSVVVAVNRRVRATCGPGDGAGVVSVRVQQRSGDELFRMTLGSDAPSPETTSRWSPLLHHVLRASLAADSSARSLTIDPSSLFLEAKDGALQKLGLGSSAAVTVAVMTACMPDASSYQPSELLGRALATHRQWQGGRGSGVDIAAAVYGGALRYQLQSDDTPRVEALSLSGLPPWRAVWTGSSASTSQLLEAVEGLQRHDPARYAYLLNRIASCAEAAIEAIRAGAVDDVLRAVVENERWLKALGEAASVPIVTEAHRELSQRARAAGLVAKPSGAGGGDLSLVMGADEQALMHFVESLQVPDLTPVSLEHDLRGVTLE